MAQVPGPGQESVWDYPRPPALRPLEARVVVRLGGGVVADTTAALVVLETSHPPSVYLPPDAFAPGVLRAAGGRSFCEFKGTAGYVDLVGPDGSVAEQVGWTYPRPTPAFADLAGFVSLYPGRVGCTVDGERVRPQGGDFYGGWVTDAVVGPWKGAPGTRGW